MKIIDSSFILLLISTISILIILFSVLRKKPINQLQKAIASVLIFILILDIGVLLQDIFTNFFQMDPVPFENVIYIGTCFLPVSLFFTALIFTKTKLKFKKIYCTLFIIPIITLIMVWTNNYHHLFYKNYSSNLAEMEYGPYFYVHTIYSYGLLFISMMIILLSLKKNSGFFSKQSILILIGSSIPIIINLMGYIGIFNITVFVTPISFTIAMIFYSIAIFKFNFLSISPIAIQRVVDNMSDSYVVLNDEYNIIDFNKTFIDTFLIDRNKIRKYNINTLIKENNLIEDDVMKVLEDVKYKNSTQVFQNYFKNINKYFNIEITPIFSDGIFLGTLILFKDTTQHMLDIQTIKSNQDMLMEKERLASLGQLIGGISHNLKTPIMSISGAVEGLNDLIKEYDASIGDSEVTVEDHHDIAKDMYNWIEKIKNYTEYMSDIITTVKGQAVTLTSDNDVDFTINELIKRVDILMKHELKNALIVLNKNVSIDENTTLDGDVNSLVQVVNNLITNSIQAYNGEKNKEINLNVFKENNKLMISVQDFGSGMSKEVQDKLFKEMITTKGKNGSGLGLFMSYSTIKANFNGNITFKSELGKGTTITIELPIK